MVVKKTYGDRIVEIFLYMLYGLFALICIFPFYYIFINTISNNDMAATGKILFIPKGVHFANYVHVFMLEGLSRAAFISVARTVIGTFISVLSASFLGYAFTKEEYWHRKFWYKYIIITMYFGAGLIPGYLNIRMLGLLNNFLVYVLPSLCQSFGMIMVKTYIESIPPSLEESAEIDGAGYLNRYINIVLPLAKPILATIAIFSAVGQWNSFMDTVLFVQKESLYTLQFILYRYLNQANVLAQLIRRNPLMASEVANRARMLSPVSVNFTITIVVILPILLVYPFFQRYLVKGIMIGAIKG